MKFLALTCIPLFLSACSGPPPSGDRDTASGASPNPADFQQWRRPPAPDSPPGNRPNANRIALGKMLFFDPRLSRDNTMSCATCHNPMFGWADGLGKARGFRGQPLERAAPSIVNAAYNKLQMWDGRKQDLEDQALGPMEATTEMNTDFEHFFAWVGTNDAYQAAFAAAYPGEPVGPGTLRKAIASFERTVISRDSPFDRWVAGDRQAMTPRQLQGLAVFIAPNKGNCAVCHAAPNFTDNGFHNIGLPSFGASNPDLGRYRERPVALMRGAFKTPSLRDIERTAPYFHDGSAPALMDVVEHYAKGGDVKTNLSPNLKPLSLSQREKEDLVAFLRALSSPESPVVLPVLPKN